jgi:hypothetical protein
MNLNKSIDAARDTLSEVFMVLYNWGESREVMVEAVNKNLVKELAQKKTTKRIARAFVAELEAEKGQRFADEKVKNLMEGFTRDVDMELEKVEALPQEEIVKLIVEVFVKHCETTNEKRINVGELAEEIERFLLLRELIDCFLEKQWGNIHMVGKDRLEQWLLPSLVPFPMLFKTMGIDDEGGGEIVKSEL